MESVLTLEAAFCSFERTSFVLATSYRPAMYRARLFMSEQYPLPNFCLDSDLMREMIIRIGLLPPMHLPQHLPTLHSLPSLHTHIAKGMSSFSHLPLPYYIH